MSDERKKFESMVKATWGDTYSFAQDGDSHYRDFVLDAMWWGWQARAEALESPNCLKVEPYRVTVKIEWEQEPNHD